MALGIHNYKTIYVLILFAVTVGNSADVIYLNHGRTIEGIVDSVTDYKMKIEDVTDTLWILDTVKTDKSLDTIELENGKQVTGIITKITPHKIIFYRKERMHPDTVTYRNIVAVTYGNIIDTVNTAQVTRINNRMFDRNRHLTYNYPHISLFFGINAALSRLDSFRKALESFYQIDTVFAGLGLTPNHVNNKYGGFHLGLIFHLSPKNSLVLSQIWNLSDINLSEDNFIVTSCEYQYRFNTSIFRPYTRIGLALSVLNLLEKQDVKLSQDYQYHGTKWNGYSMGLVFGVGFELSSQSDLALNMSFKLVPMIKKQINVERDSPITISGPLPDKIDPSFLAVSCGIQVEL